MEGLWQIHSYIFKVVEPWKDKVKEYFKCNYSQQKWMANENNICEKDAFTDIKMLWDFETVIWNLRCHYQQTKKYIKLILLQSFRTKLKCWL